MQDEAGEQIGVGAGVAGGEQENQLAGTPLADRLRLKDEVSQLAKSICTSTAGTPVAALRQLNFILEARYSEVWEMLLTPAELLQKREEADGTGEQQPAAEATNAQGAGSSDAEMAATERSDQIKPGQAEPLVEEQKEEASVKLDFYQHVLRAIADLMLAEVAVQPDVS